MSPNIDWLLDRMARECHMRRPETPEVVWRYVLRMAYNNNPEIRRLVNDYGGLA